MHFSKCISLTQKENVIRTPSHVYTGTKTNVIQESAKYCEAGKEVEKEEEGFNQLLPTCSLLAVQHL